MNEFLLSIYEMKKTYQKNFQSISKQYHLTQNEIDVLLFLYNNPNFNRASDITKYRSLTKSHVSMSIENLTKRNIIIKNSDSNDQRVTLLAIAPQADTMMQQIQKTQQAFIQRILKNIDEEDLEIFKNIWQMLIQNLRSEDK